MRQDLHLRTVDVTASVRRLRRRVFGASVGVTLAVSVLLSGWLLANGASASDLRIPFAGMILALAAELLCLDVAIRRAQRLMDPPSSHLPASRRRALGV